MYSSRNNPLFFTGDALLFKARDGEIYSSRNREEFRRLPSGIRLKQMYGNGVQTIGIGVDGREYHWSIKNGDFVEKENNIPYCSDEQPYRNGYFYCRTGELAYLGEDKQLVQLYPGDEKHTTFSKVRNPSLTRASCWEQDGLHGKTRWGSPYMVYQIMGLSTKGELTIWSSASHDNYGKEDFTIKIPERQIVEFMPVSKSVYSGCKYSWNSSPLYKSVQTIYILDDSYSIWKKEEHQSLVKLKFPDFTHVSFFGNSYNFVAIDRQGYLYTGSPDSSLLKAVDKETKFVSIDKVTERLFVLKDEAGRTFAYTPNYVPVLVPDLHEIKTVITASEYSVYFFDDIGRLWGWGFNFRKMLGEGDTEYVPPRIIEHPKNDVFKSVYPVVDLNDYPKFGVAYLLDDKGRVFTIGYGRSLVLLSEETEFKSVITKYVSGRADKFLVFVVDINNRYWGHGANSSGQLGVDSSEKFVPTLKLLPHSNFTKLGSFSGDSFWGLDNDNNFYVWGRNHKNLFANNLSSTSVPTKINSHKFKQILYFYDVVFAVDLDGKLWGWGNDTCGFMGSNNVCKDVRFPQQIMLYSSSVGS